MAGVMLCDPALLPDTRALGPHRIPTNIAIYQGLGLKGDGTHFWLVSLVLWAYHSYLITYISGGSVSDII